MAKLEEYQRKRRFDRTPEPSGEPVAGKAEAKPAPVAKHTRLPKPKLPQLEVRPGAEHGDTFVVQKHRATRLHYDVRLAIDGTLKSWAVPKGNRSAAALPGASAPRTCRHARPRGELPTVAVSALAGACVWRPGRAWPRPCRRRARLMVPACGRSGVFAGILRAWPCRDSISWRRVGRRVAIELLFSPMIALRSLSSLLKNTVSLQLLFKRTRLSEGRRRRRVNARR